MNNSPIFFISYARVELQFMQAIIKSTMDNDGIIYWYDEHMDSTLEDDKWWKEIVRQIEASPYFIFLFTDKWQKSEICRKELATAESMGKDLIPVQMNEFNISNDFNYIKQMIGIVQFHQKKGDEKCNYSDPHIINHKAA